MGDKGTTLEQIWAEAERMDPEGWAKSQAAHAELLALHRDAARYRAIRRPRGLGWPIAVFDLRHPMNAGKPAPYECIGDTFDALVDAAIAESAANGAA